MTPVDRHGKTAPLALPPTPLRIRARHFLHLLHILAGLALLVALDWAGRWIVVATALPIPGSVVGMLLLLALLESSLLPVARVRAAAELLVRYLGLLYVPAGVAIILYVAAVRDSAIAIAVAGLASLVAVLIVVGTIVQRFEREP